MESARNKKWILISCYVCCFSPKEDIKREIKKRVKEEKDVICLKWKHKVCEVFLFYLPIDVAVWKAKSAATIQGGRHKIIRRFWGESFCFKAWKMQFLSWFLYVQIKSQCDDRSYLRKKTKSEKSLLLIRNKILNVFRIEWRWLKSWKKRKLWKKRHNCFNETRYIKLWLSWKKQWRNLFN